MHVAGRTTTARGSAGRVVVWGGLWFALGGAVLGGTGCGSSPDVAPLPDDPAGTVAAAAAEAATETGPEGTAPRGPDGATAADATGESDTTDATGAPDDVASGDGADPAAVVTDLLGRYDRALTDMSATPDGPSPGSPARRRWAGAVVEGSVLDSELVARVRTRHGDGLVVEPGPSGLSWEHSLVELGAVGPDRVAFTWCSVSHGVVREAATGAVVDDAVGRFRGTGEAVRRADGWRLESLVTVDEVPGPPGTAGHGGTCP